MRLVLFRWRSAAMLSEVIVPEHVAVLVADRVIRVHVRSDDLVYLLVPARASLEVVVVHEGATLCLISLLLLWCPALGFLRSLLHAGHNNVVSAVVLGQADPVITTGKRKFPL